MSGRLAVGIDSRSKSYRELRSGAVTKDADFITGRAIFLGLLRLWIAAAAA